ncbi:Hypothetical protein SCF082_LOCUS34492, partial [Durusdinium trenchii]
HALRPLVPTPTRAQSKALRKAHSRRLEVRAMATEIAAARGEVSQGEFTLEDDQRLLKELNSKTYKDQAIWFLNAFWKLGPAFGEDEDKTERVWEVYNMCVQLDSKGQDGNELNEFDAHRLLEKVDRALTVREMREVLREIDIDFNKSMSLTEYLVFKYNVNWRELVHAPQGGVDEAKLNLAQQKVDEAKEDIAASEKRASEAKASEKEAVAAEKEAIDAKAEAKDSEQRAKDAEEQAKSNEADAFREETRAKEAEQKCITLEEEQRAVQVQVNEALETVKREEATFQAKIDELEATGSDDSKGIVTRNKAKAELAQLKSSDPMPLQRAKISQEAVVRRAERAVKSAAA